MTRLTSPPEGRGALGGGGALLVSWENTPYEGLNLTNQKNRKLGVFSRKLDGRHYPFQCYFDKYKRKVNKNKVFSIDLEKNRNRNYYL